MQPLLELLVKILLEHQVLKEHNKNKSRQQKCDVFTQNFVRDKISQENLILIICVISKLKKIRDKLIAIYYVSHHTLENIGAEQSQALVLLELNY